MAKDKKSVLLYCDIIHTVEALTDQEAGVLFKHYLRYINDLNPEYPDRITKITFEPIKQNLKRDLKKWETKSERNSEIAKAAWQKRNEANVSERILNDANNTDKDNVKVNDKDNVKEIRKVFSKPTLDEIIEYFVTKTENNWNKVLVQNEGQKFFNHYESNGWMVGKNKMKDWKAAINGWIVRNEKSDSKEKQVVYRTLGEYGKQ